MPVKPVPEGHHTVAPYLIASDAARLIEFLTRAFGAQIDGVFKTPDGTIMHAEVRIGDSVVMLAQGGPMHPAETATIHLYVPDSDATYQQALQAGATSLREVQTQFYGDRSGGVKDPTGNSWWISTHVEDVSPEEMDRRAAEFFKKQQAPV